MSAPSGKAGFDRGAHRAMCLVQNIMNVDEHAAHPMPGCPVCRSRNVVHESRDGDGTWAWEDAVCRVCHSAWTNVYVLASQGYINLRLKGAEKPWEHSP